jgi:hypothetical protein
MLSSAALAGAGEKSSAEHAHAAEKRASAKKPAGEKGRVFPGSLCVVIGDIVFPGDYLSMPLSL